MLVVDLYSKNAIAGVVVAESLELVGLVVLVVHLSLKLEFVQGIQRVVQGLQWH